MAEDKYFQQALQNFTMDVASGDAIRHLADKGFSVGQIRNMLDFPTPYDRVQRTVWEHFLDTGRIRLEEPGRDMGQESYAYVTEYDQYGRKSFRRVTVGETAPEAVEFREQIFEKTGPEPFLACLARLCQENGEETSYISCDFGLRAKREPDAFLRALACLDEDGRDYVLGLPWERRLVYHRLDRRMREIAARLYGQGDLHGSCYFVKIGQKLRF